MPLLLRCLENSSSLIIVRGYIWKMHIGLFVNISKLLVKHYSYSIDIPYLLLEYCHFQILLFLGVFCALIKAKLKIHYFFKGFATLVF